LQSTAQHPPNPLQRKELLVLPKALNVGAQKQKSYFATSVAFLISINRVATVFGNYLSLPYMGLNVNILSLT